MGTPGFPFIELFAGSGAVHLAMAEAGFRAAFANDFCPHKRASYATNFPDVPLDGRSIADIRGHELPGADVITASSPCQDHSINGRRQGFGGGRGRMALEVVRLAHELRQLGRAPKVIAFENVTGLLTLNGGQDFAALCQALVSAGYRTGAVVINALRFVPQNRERLFLVAVRADLELSGHLQAAGPVRAWHPDALRRAHAALPIEARRGWCWWTLPRPPRRSTRLADLLDPETEATRWLDAKRRDSLAGLMRPVDAQRIARARAAGVSVGVTSGTLRGVGDALRRIQEVALDGHARCLLTGDGHKVQRLILLDDSPLGFRIRDFSPRERARLMGLPDSYVLPAARGRAVALTGDAVAVPAYAWLALHLLRPLAGAEVAAVQARTPQPRRSCKQSGADGRIVSARRGIKGRTTTLTAYLVPDAANRLKTLAAEAGIPASELLLRGVDRLLAERGQPPLERYVPQPRRRKARVSRRGMASGKPCRPVGCARSASPIRKRRHMELEDGFPAELSATIRPQGGEHAPCPSRDEQ